MWVAKLVQNEVWPIYMVLQQFSSFVNKVATADLTKKLHALNLLYMRSLVMRPHSRDLHVISLCVLNLVHKGVRMRNHHPTILSP